jgi:predicted RNase H-like HicB family nuclease
MDLAAEERDMKYTVIIERGQESGYVAIVPALRGCVSQGKTRNQTLANVKEAVEGYIEALLEEGLPVPTDANGRREATSFSGETSFLHRSWFQPTEGLIQGPWRPYLMVLG